MIRISIIIVGLLLLSIGKIFAQDFSGMAVYETKMTAPKITFSGSGITPEIEKSLEEKVKKNFEKTYTLSFDKSASLYEEEERLKPPLSSSGGSGMQITVGDSGKKYKNIKEKRYALATEIMGKEFLIKDSLPKLNWKLENETRKIGDYTCYKATLVRKVEKSGFKDKESSGKAKTTSLLKDLESPDSETITAWYAPEIPISQGPDDYWGLPGLILEINEKKSVILCSKIVLNPKEKKEVKEPKNGKVVTQKEYDAILEKKMEEQLESFQNSKGKTIIRVGG